MVWTIDYIYISRTAEDTVIDSIPFSDADKVRVLEKLESIPSENVSRNSSEFDGKESAFEKRWGDESSRRVHPDSSTKLKKKATPLSRVASIREKKEILDSDMDEAKTLDDELVLQITTIHEGFNSGIDFFVL